MKKKVRGRGDVISWFPIDLNIEVALGLSAEGKWFVDTADGVVDLSDSRSTVFLLRLLELPFEDFEQRYKNALANDPIASLYNSDLPIFEIVAAGLQGGSYWMNLAFKWLDYINLTSTQRDYTIRILTKIVDDKSFNQKVRHSAQRKLKELQNNNIHEH